MAPTIRVDDEVYAALQAEAQAFVDTPNTVLRGSSGSICGRDDHRQPAAGYAIGRIGKLLEDRILNPMDELTWNRRQHGMKHVAWVTREGALQLDDGTLHGTPSGAACHLAGYEVNGWRQWRHAASGKTLDELLNQAREGARGDGMSETARR